MIDLHSHILPCMDDGSPDVATSLEMLRRMADQGVKTVCASSHYYAEENSIPTFCARRQVGFEQLQSAREIGRREDPAVLLAAEVAYFPQISESGQLSRLCIEGTSTLLLEMPFAEWNDFQREEVTSLVLDRGFQVVLVHPERFLFSENNRRQFEKLQELPIGVQVNAGSLIRWSTRKTALYILEQASCPLLGSDAHNLVARPPNMKEGRRVIERKLGRLFWQQMQENAGSVIGCAVTNA